MHPNDGRVVSNFIVQALQNQPITVYGDGSQTRSFCFVEDLIEAIIRFMNTSEEITGPMNLGNPDEFTISKLAGAVIELTGSRSKIVYESLPDDDHTQRKPDIALAREKLGWTPSTGLEDGLKKTIGYFEALLSEAKPSSG